MEYGILSCLGEQLLLFRKSRIIESEKKKVNLFLPSGKYLKSGNLYFRKKFKYGIKRYEFDLVQTWELL